jgi:hypothetical protein
MASNTATSTATLIPYSHGVYHSDLSISTAELLYQYCHGTYSERIAKAFDELEMDEGEQRPSNETIASIVTLIDKVAKTKSLFQPDVAAFYGEAVVTWRFGKREVSLVSRGRPDDPKMLKYVSNEHGPGHQEVIERVTERQLTRAIHYSLRDPGWLYE